MRRWIILVMLALFVTLCFTIIESVAQQPVVDSQKSRQELETMEGILSTTLGYAVKRLGPDQANQARQGDWAFRFHGMGPSEVTGYYVYGQGAVFVIPISALEHQHDFAFAMPDINGIVDASVNVGLEAAAASLKALSGETDISDADAAQAKEKAEKAQQKAEDRQKEMAQRVERQKARMQQLQEQAKKRQAEMEQRRKDLISRLGQVTVDLKDALARYGDSLSIVKPEESVTIILSGDRDFRWGDSQAQSDVCHILTVRKSLVTDLKAGKITREDFDRRVVDYSY